MSLKAVNFLVGIWKMFGQSQISLLAGGVLGWLVGIFETFRLGLSLPWDLASESLADADDDRVDEFGCSVRSAWHLERDICDEHPGRMTRNGLGSLEIGAARSYPED